MVKKQPKTHTPKFDWSGFKLFVVVGLIMSAFGTFLFWATYTAPTGHVSQMEALTTTQRLTRMIPTETATKIAFVVSVLFVLFGLFLMLTAFYRSLKFLFFKRN
jgi:di/tricarboxylate transporter